MNFFFLAENYVSLYSKELVGKFVAKSVTRLYYQLQAEIELPMKECKEPYNLDQTKLNSTRYYGLQGISVFITPISPSNKEVY